MIQIFTGNYFKWQPITDRKIELDLGCGKGGYLISLAEMYPNRLVIGADIMLGRLRRVHKHVVRSGLKNVQLLRVNAWDLIGYCLPDYSIHRVHVLCPDPWPKTRHRSRRLMTSEFLGRLAQKLVPGGTLHFSSDDNQYFEFIMEAIENHGHYVNDSAAITDVKHVKTDFELRFECCGIAIQHNSFITKSVSTQDQRSKYRVEKIKLTQESSVID